MKGQERELLLHEYFREVLPQLYRFGQGAITDSRGGLSGQVDIVLELPLAPSFPMPAGSQRLYLAESVAAVIEVKSNLAKQWGQVRSTTRKVKSLHRDLRETTTFILTEGTEPDARIESIEGIPCYAVGFQGFATLAGLQRRLLQTPIEERPHGALVISPGLFCGVTGEAEKEVALYHFIAELVEVFNTILGIANPHLRQYLDAI